MIAGATWTSNSNLNTISAQIVCGSTIARPAIRAMSIQVSDRPTRCSQASSGRTSPRRARKSLLNIAPSASNAESTVDMMAAIAAPMNSARNDDATGLSPTAASIAYRMTRSESDCGSCGNHSAALIAISDSGNITISGSTISRR